MLLIGFTNTLYCLSICLPFKILVTILVPLRTLLPIEYMLMEVTNLYTFYIGG